MAKVLLANQGWMVWNRKPQDPATEQKASDLWDACVGLRSKPIDRAQFSASVSICQRMPSVLHEIEAYGKLGALYSLQPGSWCVQVFETAESRARERGVSPHDFVWAYIGHNKANAYRHLKQYGPARKTCCAALEILKNGLEEVKNSETMYSAVEQTMHLFATLYHADNILNVAACLYRKVLRLPHLSLVFLFTATHNLGMVELRRLGPPSRVAHKLVNDSIRMATEAPLDLQQVAYENVRQVLGQQK